jgi:uncharacterized cupredoxin-like copper-binding protein
MRDDIAVLAIVTAMALSFIVGYSFSPGVPAGLEDLKSSPASSAAAAPAKGVAEAKEFTIEASEFKFEPATITVSEGDVVRITIKNVGSQVHNFVIDELGVCAVKPEEAAAEGYGEAAGYGAGYGEAAGYGEETAQTQVGIQPGASVTVEFVAEKAGEYTFYCPVNGHREKGMEGKLIVKPKAEEAQPAQTAEEGAGYGEATGYGEEALGYGEAAGYGAGY